MKRKRWLIFLLSQLYYVLLTRASQSNKVYVCPIDNDAVNDLVKLRYQFLCNISSADCLSHEYHKDSYSVFIMLLHDGDWSLIKNVTEHLSLCNFKYILVDVRSPLVDLVGSTCSAATTTIVFSLTAKIIYSAQINFPNDDCITKLYTKKNKFQQQITLMCQNTIWITGSVDCKNMTSYGEKVLALNNERDIIRDKSLGKMYLKDKHLRLGMIPGSPYYMEDGQGGHYGILHNLVEKISNNIQFTYSVHYPEDNQYGGIGDDGNWTGLVGDLINNRTDVIIADLTVTFPRSEQIDFTLPYYFESIGILIKQPGLDSSLWKMFSLFPSNIWLAMLVTVIIASFVLYGLHIFSALPINSPFNKFGECFWCIFSCFANQGSEYDPMTWSVQNFMALFWFYVFAMLSIYSGGMIATLTSSHMVMPFKDLEGLSIAVAQDRFKVCVVEGTAFHTTLMAGVGVYAPIRDWLRKYPSYQTDQATCEKLLKDNANVAYLEEVTVLETIQNDYCSNYKFILLNEKFFPGYFAIGLPKNSPLNGIFSEELTMAVDGGLILGWKKNFTKDSMSFCKILQPDDIVTADSNDLTLPEFAGPFILLGIGISVSCMGFLYEIRKIICQNKRKLSDSDNFFGYRRNRKRNNWIRY